MPDIQTLLAPLQAMHARIRDAVVAACEKQAVESLSAVAHDDDGDTIYAIDKVSEHVLVECLDQIARASPLVLIAEGLPGGRLVLPHGSDESRAVWRVIVDPIDGTRGIMYQKRSGWILTGVAPNRGPATRLSDIELAIQTEIPLVKQHLSDQCWARRGQGVIARRHNRITGQDGPLTLRPSTANTILHGCAAVTRFFPGARDVLAAIDDEIVVDCVGQPPPGKALCFEDQYASTGGQLFELMTGHDRFVADIRPLMASILKQRGVTMGLCCHPYDVCTALIARELGVAVCDVHGRDFDAPMDVDANIAWVGYANAAIRRQVEPALRAALQRRHLLES